MNETSINNRDASVRRRLEVLQTIRNAGRESYHLDDQLRWLCIEQARDTLQGHEANTRERLSAAAFVLKLNEFNLERTLLMAEINAILDESEVDDQTIDVVINENFFRNEAHEKTERAHQNASDETNEKAADRSPAAAPSSTGDPT
ncbi:hypothetical protein [Blastopirellula marina]|uniref:hypothetical protein n=1 Tax=Blastopirellula marina TaxID=124 RepID=UPI00032387BB|nr:hypothetical protein [Blastopirellula marina]